MYKYVCTVNENQESGKTPSKVLFVHVIKNRY